MKIVIFFSVVFANRDICTATHYRNIFLRTNEYHTAYTGKAWVTICFRILTSPINYHDHLCIGTSVGHEQPIRNKYYGTPMFCCWWSCRYIRHNKTHACTNIYIVFVSYHICVLVSSDFYSHELKYNGRILYIRRTGGAAIINLLVIEPPIFIA